MSLTTVQWSLTTRQGLCLALALSLAGGPALAAPPADQDDASAEIIDAGEDGSEANEGDSGSTNAKVTEDADSTPSPDLIVETEEPKTASGIGGGNVISSTDPEAKRARADLEGTAMLDSYSPTSDVPERLPRLQRAAWWTMFGTFALATTGGVFAGLAEVQEDRALRLTSTIDLTTGGSYLYGDKQTEYQDILDKGARQASIGRGFLIGAGVTLIAGIALFAVAGKRSKNKKKPTRARLRPTGGGLEVHF